MPCRVHAFCRFGAYHRVETEGDVTAYVEYSNGGTGIYITSTRETPGVNRLKVSGDNGRAVLEASSIKLYRNDGSVSNLIANDVRSMPTWSG